MTLKITGFDSAPSIPEGAKLSRISWHVAGDYDQGPSFGSLEEALTDGLIEARRLTRPTLTVDLRWKMVFPGGGGIDTVAQRYTYENLGAAQEHLERIRLYSPGDSR